MFRSRVTIHRVHMQAGVVELIEEHGIDERFGQLDGLFGAGNYFAENASKVRWRPCLLVLCKRMRTDLLRLLVFQI